MSIQKTKKPSPAWVTQEDFLNDIWAYSEFDEPAEVKPEKLKTLVEWENRNMQNNNKSIFDEEVPEENVQYYISGRGKRMHHRTVTPGEPIRHHVSDDEEIRRKIREVNGIIFRNEFIEHVVQSKRALNNQYQDVWEDSEEINENDLLQNFEEELTLTSSKTEGKPASLEDILKRGRSGRPHGTRNTNSRSDSRESSISPALHSSPRSSPDSVLETKIAIKRSKAEGNRSNTHSPLTAGASSSISNGLCDFDSSFPPLGKTSPNQNRSKNTDSPKKNSVWRSTRVEKFKKQQQLCGQDFPPLRET